MNTRTIGHVLVLSAALMIAMGPYVVRAASGFEQGEVTANVDTQKLFADSDARFQAMKRADEYGRVMGQRFDEIGSTPFLTAADVADYSEALQVTPPTEASKKKIDELKSRSKQLADEMRNLNNKPDAQLTPADKKRLNELNGLNEPWRQAMNRMKQLYQEKVNDELEKQMRVAQAEVREAIAKVAKQQGVSQVFDTTAMVYSKVDLTPAVMGKIKKAQP